MKKILFGETEHRRPGVYKVAQCVSAHVCLAKTPSIAIWGQKIEFFMKKTVFPGHGQKKHGAQNKNIKKEAILSTNDVC